MVWRRHPRVPPASGRARFCCFLVVTLALGIGATTAILLSELVLRRTRELGIRMALGADHRRIARMVQFSSTASAPFWRGLGFACCGVILRFAFRPLFIRMLPAFDPVLIGFVPLAFITVALVAIYLPARRESTR